MLFAIHTTFGEGQVLMQFHNDSSHKIFMHKNFHILNTQMAKILVPQIDSDAFIGLCDLNVFMNVRYCGSSDFYINFPCQSNYNLINFIGIIFHSRQLHNVIHFVKQFLLQIKPYDLLIIFDDAQFLIKLEDVINKIPLFTKERFLVILGMYKTILENAIIIFVSHYHGDLQISHANNFQCCVISHLDSYEHNFSVMLELVLPMKQMNISF